VVIKNQLFECSNEILTAPILNSLLLSQVVIGTIEKKFFSMIGTRILSFFKLT